MIARRALGRVALVLLALGAGLLASPATSGAATFSKSAWWYRTSQPASFVPPAAQPPVPLPIPETEPVAPPSVAEGDLLVQGTPEGATAIAAMTWLLQDGESSPILTITPTEPVPPTSVVLACRAALDWTMPETQPGSWQDKPLVDCGRSVNGIPNTDGTEWTFPIAPLVSGTDLDIVLVPGLTGESTPAGNIGSAFTMTFSATEGAVLATTPGTTTTSGGSSSPGTFTPASGGTPSFGGDTGFSPPETPVAAPSLEPQDQAPRVPQQPMLQTPTAAEEDTTPQGIGFIILLAGLAAAGWAYVTPDRREDGVVGLGRFRRPMPDEALAVPVEPVTGGLGRFTRPRTGPPPALS